MREIFAVSKTLPRASALALSLTALLSIGAAKSADQAQIPNFSFTNDGWIAINSDFVAVEGSPKPVTWDPKYPFRRNDEAALGQATYRVADIDNSNLKPWAVAELKRYNEKVFAGEIGTTPRWSCLPGGVPGFSIFVVEPVYFIQAPDRVVMVYSGDHQFRHVYLNVPHSKNPKPSWYGESVGHYEGDTLVVDTIGLSPKAVVDNYHTPHTEKLHVIERYHLIDGGRRLEVNLTIDDPDTFNAPWQTKQTYTKTANRPMLEQNCSENNLNFFSEDGFVGPPTAAKADF
jgi:hypothetical protein